MLPDYQLYSVVGNREAMSSYSLYTSMYSTWGRDTCQGILSVNERTWLRIRREGPEA